MNPGITSKQIYSMSELVSGCDIWPIEPSKPSFQNIPCSDTMVTWPVSHPGVKAWSLTLSPSSFSATAVRIPRWIYLPPGEYLFCLFVPRCICLWFWVYKQIDCAQYKVQYLISLCFHLLPYRNIYDTILCPLPCVVLHSIGAKSSQRLHEHHHAHY